MNKTLMITACLTNFLAGMVWISNYTRFDGGMTELALSISHFILGSVFVLIVSQKG